jgi:hypothetical protein
MRADKRKRKRRQVQRERYEAKQVAGYQSFARKQDNTNTSASGTSIDFTTPLLPVSLLLLPGLVRIEIPI